MKFRTFLKLYRSLYSVLVIGVLNAELLICQSSPKTNMEQFVDVADSVWEACLSEIHIGPDRSVAVRGFEMENSVHGLIHRRLEMALHKKNIRPWNTSDSTSPDRYLSVDILEAGVLYFSGGRKNILGKKWIRRHAICHLSVQLKSGSDHIQASSTCRKEKTDRIPLRSLSYIEQQGAVLGHPERPEDTGLFSRLETWFMIGSLSVIVYLFYTIRS